MIVEIDVVILDPHGLGQVDGHLRQLSLKYRCKVKALAEHRLDVLVVVTLVTLREIEQH